MTKFGLTVLLRVYTSTQYATLSTAVKELCFRLLGLVLIYFNLNPNGYIRSDKHEVARRAAGICGLVFTICSSIDAVLRTKYKGIRAFDEAAISSLYIALFALFYSMYEKISLIAVGVIGVAMFIGFVGLYTVRQISGVDPFAPRASEDFTAILNAVVEGGDVQGLRLLALELAVTHGEDPNTISLIERVREGL